MFTDRHQVQFYETDMMGIVHHSNYLRFAEEARVAWAHSKGLIDYQRPESAAHFAVLETRVRHVKPSRFGDLIETDVQARREGARILFQYRLRVGPATVALIETAHVALDKNLKLMRLTPEMAAILEKEKWTETWLSNS